jgi:Uma2 family endonuclease
MATVVAGVEFRTIADLLEHLGIAAERVRLKPPPGLATEVDVINSRRPCELIDGVLVEKPVGWYESHLAVLLAYFLVDYLKGQDLGIIVGEAGPMRVEPNQVRVPDVAFYSWDHFPDRLVPDGPILDVVPDLAVEVLSPSNTKKEMARTRSEYFAGGCKLVWEVDRDTRSAAVYTTPDDFTTVDETGTLDGGAVLPGFTLKLSDLFARAGKRS